MLWFSYALSQTVLQRWKKRLKEQPRNKYRELFEEKNIKREYVKNRYHNMSEAKKQKNKRISKKLSCG